MCDKKTNIIYNCAVCMCAPKSIIVWYIDKSIGTNYTGQFALAITNRSNRETKAREREKKRYSAETKKNETHSNMSDNEKSVDDLSVCIPSYAMLINTFVPFAIAALAIATGIAKHRLAAVREIQLKTILSVLCVRVIFLYSHTRAKDSSHLCRRSCVHFALCLFRILSCRPQL